MPVLLAEGVRPSLSTPATSLRPPLVSGPHDDRMGDDMMDGMGWTMGGMGLVWILLLVVLVLAAAALIKYLRR